MAWRIALPDDHEHLERYLSQPGRNATLAADRLRRFGLDRKARKVHRFYLWQTTTGIGAVLYHGARGFFFPVGLAAVPECAGSIRRAVGGLVRLHSVMGITADVELFALQFQHPVSNVIDYHGMALSHRRYPQPTAPPLHRLTRRLARIEDTERLLPLHICYEREEVLLPGRTQHTASSREILRESLRTQTVMIGELDGAIIARAATNAIGFREAQIGGVYTSEPYRGRGVAAWLMTELLAPLGAQGIDVTLFVKLSNAQAIALYQKLGFSIVTSFRIQYYF